MSSAVKGDRDLENNLKRVTTLVGSGVVSALIAIAVAWILQPTCTDYSGVWGGKPDPHNKDYTERWLLLSSDCQINGRMLTGNILHELSGTTKRRWWGEKTANVVVIRTNLTTNTQTSMIATIEKQGKDKLFYDIIGTDGNDPDVAADHDYDYEWIRTTAVPLPGTKEKTIDD